MSQCLRTHGLLFVDVATCVDWQAESAKTLKSMMLGYIALTAPNETKPTEVLVLVYLYLAFMNSAHILFAVVPMTDRVPCSKSSVKEPIM